MNKIHLLLVEDDREMCEELVPILRENGYWVDAAHDGKSAISHLEKSSYRLILLDLKMPGINGYEVLKYVKSLYPATKIIVISGSPLRKEDLKEEEQVFPSGTNYENMISQLADDFIGKPFAVETVLEKIEKVLGR